MTFLKHIGFAWTARERIAFFVAAGSALVTLVILLGILVEKRTAAVPASGGEYVEGMVGQPASVNPVLATTDVDKALSRLLFSSLTELAQTIESDREHRIWNVRLKENLAWSDGKKLTSDDVIFTVHAIQNPETRSPSITSFQGVVPGRISELEMQFTLSRPYPLFPETLERLFIIPKHLFADIPPQNWRLSEYTLRPTGSGAYRFEALEKEHNGFITEYRLAPNTRAALKQPLVELFSFKFFVKHEDMVKAFNAGAIDGFAAFEPASLSSVERPYQAVPFRLPSYYAVFLNQSQHLALKEAAVRNALSLAVDRARLAREVFEGYAAPVGGLSAIGRENGASEPFSQEEAARILEEADWKRNAGGIREKEIKNATITITFDFVVPDIPFLVQTALRLADGWALIGIRANPVVLPLEEISDRVIKNREYQGILFGNILNAALDPYPFWHSNERFYPGLNLALYNNREADRLIEEARHEPDPEQRREKLRALNAVMREDAPAVFLYAPSYLMVLGKDIKSIQGGFIADPALRFADAASWHLKTARAIK